MSPAPIPLLQLTGTYAEVGAGIGEACHETIARACDVATWDLPSGRGAEDQLALADRYAEVTRRLMP